MAWKLVPVAGRCTVTSQPPSGPSNSARAVGLALALSIHLLLGEGVEGEKGKEGRGLPKLPPVSLSSFLACYLQQPSIVCCW
jgi:hypothetical protein